MDEGYQWLEAIANRMKKEIDRGAAASPESLTVRDLLRKFGYEKRGHRINKHIRKGLRKFKLRVVQDFTAHGLDSQVIMEIDSDAPGAPCLPLPAEPTHRIGALKAARRSPARVKPQSPLNEATFTMQMKNYSQLPVMRHERDVSGIVTWRSINKRRSQGLECKTANDCMDERVNVVSESSRLFEAVRTGQCAKLVFHLLVSWSYWRYEARYRAGSDPGCEVWRGRAGVGRAQSPPAAAESLAVGYGGDAVVSSATGLARETIRKGRREIARDEAPTDRIRRPGGGRPRIQQDQPGIQAALEALVDPLTRGDPTSPLRWTCKSRAKLAGALVDRIGNVRTATGLRVLAELDAGLYPTGVTVTKEQMDALALVPDAFHGE